MRNFTCFFFLFILFVFNTLVTADDEFDDLLKKQNKEFEQLLKKSDDEFEKLKKVDAEFAEILNRAWKELDLNTGIKPDTTPKPETPPLARPAEAPSPAPITPPPEPIIPPSPPKPRTEPKPVLPVGKVGIPLSFDYYGTPLRMTCDSKVKYPLEGQVNEKTISAFWEALSTSDFKAFLIQALQIRKELSLNDWGYCQFLNTAGQNLYAGSVNESILFTWFMMVQSGYDARVGFADNQVYILLPSLNIVYSAQYYTLGKNNYYIMLLNAPDKTSKSLYTYEGNYGVAGKPMDYAISTPPDITGTINRKMFRFAYSGKTYNLALNLHQGVIDFFGKYPQTSLGVYFQTSMTAETRNALLAALKPIVLNQTEEEAVNILLRFVQTAFAYKTDEAQFGREKYFFPEETLYYPYSDCEDRAVLFSFLVRNLLNLDVVGLDYPGHVATAVRFTGNVSGDAVTHNSARYVICDPTYVNALRGECMPVFKKVTPTIVQIAGK